MATKRQLIHAQLINAAQTTTSVRQDYFLWAAEIIGRRERNVMKQREVKEKEDKQLKLL